MKNQTKTSNKASFLDVSEYILKEYSPLLKPKSPENKILEVMFQPCLFNNNYLLFENKLS